MLRAKIASRAARLRKNWMHILYINHYAGSPKYGMEYRPHYLARHWVRCGHQVTVIAASFSHLRFQSPEMPGNMREEAIDGVRYLWLKTPSYYGNGTARVINMATFVSKLFRMKAWVAREFSPDVVIASSTYTWDIVPAHAIARAAGAKLIFEVHDLWPLSPVELGGMSRWHPFIMSLQWAEDYACRHADLIVSMLPMARLHLCERGMAPEKFHYVPNGIELMEWDRHHSALPKAHMNRLHESRKKGRFLIGFAGSHCLSDALDVLLDVAQLMADEPVDFVLVGQGTNKAMLQEMAIQMELRNVYFLDPVPKDAIPALLRAMDCLYIGSLNPSLYRFGISPNKLMDYMAAGKPIICAIDAANDVVGDAGCGFTVRSGGSRAIADAIVRMMHLPAAARKQMGEAGNAYVRARHDYAVLADQFLRLMGAPSVTECGFDSISDTHAMNHYRS